MFLSPIFTASTSGLRRAPPHVGHGRSLMYRSRSIRVKSLVVSLYERSTQPMTPSNSTS